MISANKIKFINSLKSKKNRHKSGYFVAEGDKIVGDLLRSDWAIKNGLRKRKMKN